MATSEPVTYRRYRRRILGWSAVGVAALVIVGAPIYAVRIEHDLERRVPDELAVAGFAGVEASFSGQDGTLRCTAPLSDPERAQRVANGVRGVRVIELDRACRVNAAPNVEPSAVDEPDPRASTDGPAVVDDTVPVTSPPDTTVEAEPTTTVAREPDFASIVDVIESDPQFSVLAVLVDEAGLNESLSDPEGVLTMFAPTDDAFEALDADLLGQLRADPTQLASLLNHHVVAATLPAATLRTGSLIPLEGGPLDVVVDGTSIMVDGAIVTAPDLESGGGVVHGVDAVMVSDALEPIESDEATVLATLARGRLVFTGTVGSDDERAALFASAATSLASESIDDELVIDPAGVVEESGLAAMVSLVDDMPRNLVSGAVGFDGVDVFAVGVAVDDTAATAFTTQATAVGVTPELTRREAATDADAARLEGQLNDFVTANPILFEPNGADLSAGSLTVLDQLAGIAKAYDGVSIEIIGHTDSDGTTAVNQALSEARAGAVLGGLVARGVPAADLGSSGRGDAEPILVDGTEDKAASRRVEFRAAIIG